MTSDHSMTKAEDLCLMVPGETIFTIFLSLHVERKKVSWGLLVDTV